MKRFAKLVSLLLTLALLLTSLIACGGAKETETDPAGETESETAAPLETETGFDRNSVKDDIPETLNFSNADNNTITFFVRNDVPLWEKEMDVDEITDDTLYDAIYQRNRTVEQRLGVEITTISQSGNFTNRNEWNQTLRNAVNTKSGDFDASAIYMSTGSALATEGMYQNVLDFPNINLEKPWWNKSIQDELTLFDTLYYLAGDIAITETAVGATLFFNKDLLKEYYPDNMDLYQLVRDGEWTVDAMYDVIAPVWEDVNSDGEKSDGDVFGYTIGIGDGSEMDAWVAALGINITEDVDGIPELSFYSERTISAFEKVQDLYLRNTGSYRAGGIKESTFTNGNSLFSLGKLETGSSFRDVTFQYGVVPLPKLDTDQESYRTICVNTASLVVILASLPAERREMVGATLELMAAESYKQVTPAFYDIVLKSKYSNAPDDAEMYDLILSSFTISFGYCYSTVSLGKIGSLFRDITIDLAQTYEANEEVYQTALETLIDKLDEVAFLAESGQ